ncbi:STAS domain-containing protein [Candidatus Peregrinibacteria bacterium]|nr:STAS domain-containing protein [Candidatus Peregrinibacteria bacterium]
MTYVNISVENIESSDKGKPIKLIKFSGQLDESNVDESAKKIYKLVEENPEKLSLIFDFSDLDYMNSKSIGYLTDWYGRITGKDGKIVIAKAKENIRDILDVVGLTQLIHCYPSVEEAKLAIMTK